MNPSHVLIEFDLSGAEWVVVAYLSQDPNMLRVVESGKSPHIVTGALMSGAPEDWVEKEHKAVGSSTDPTTIDRLRRQLQSPPGLKFLPRSMSIRQAGKKSNHALNYDMRYRRFALENEMMEGEAEPIVLLYRNEVYPRVFDSWHPAIRKEMKDNNRTMTNCFGRKIRLLDEWGPALHMAAYSFKPQSTVFDCVREAMIRAYRDESAPFRPIKLGTQVHDSIMVNYPVPSSLQEWENLAIFVTIMARDYMRPQLIYNDVPFRLGCDVKMGISWGRMKGLPLDIGINSSVERLTHNIESLTQVFDALEKAEQRHLSPPEDPQTSPLQFQESSPEEEAA